MKSNLSYSNKRTFIPVVMGWLGYTAAGAAWSTAQVAAVGAAAAAGTVAVGVVAASAIKGSDPKVSEAVVSDLVKAESSLTEAGEKISKLEKDRERLTDALEMTRQDNRNKDYVISEKDKVITVLTAKNSVLSDELRRSKGLNGRIESVTKGITAGVTQYLEQVDRNLPPLI